MGGIFSRGSTSKTQLPPIEEVKVEDPVVTRSLGFAWVTLATNDSYSLGALVLAHSLRNVNTAHKMAILITPAVSQGMREQLSTVFDLVKMVDVLDSEDEAHLALMKRPELGVTFTKIHCWRLTEYEKCVFLDADTLVIRNCDELFDREELSAAPDVGWPDCFNTGVFVYKPSVDTFNNLIKFSLEAGSFDGGDQGLLNQFFGDWATQDIKKHLPFMYNLTSVAVYSYIPAFKQYGSQARIIHFIGSGKPWLQQMDPSTKKVNPGPGAEHLAPMLQMWWDIFCEKVHPSMSTNLECASGMRNDDDVEACAIVETQIAEPVKPFTPYFDKDDSRQINLPYQPFHVRSSTGELLNISYLEKREQELLEEEKRKEDGEAKDDRQDGQKEGMQETMQSNDYTENRHPEPESVSSPKEEETRQPEEKEDKQPEESINREEKSVAVVAAVVVDKEDSPTEEKEKESSFTYENFFPDEKCVRNYLEQNALTYQTVSNNENQWDKIEDNVPLPRFLALAEDDKRQSLNVFNKEPQHEEKPAEEASPPCEREEPKIVKQASEENLAKSEIVPELLKTKSMPILGDPSPPVDNFEEHSFWKSCSNLNVDPNRKYSMPKLKPLLPKQAIAQVRVEKRPKITQYTEFDMKSEYKDSLPTDKIGFVERFILEEVKIKDMDKDMKLRTLSYIFPQKSLENRLPKFIPSYDDMMDYDLSLCQRQKGNQPLKNLTNTSRVNNCFLPVLKPIKPVTKGSKSKSSKERGTKAKVESRKAREKAKTEIKPVMKPSSVEDVLKRLIGFSKDYQKYFTEKHKTELTPPLKKMYQESPRLQYSKEFEDPTYDSAHRPLTNGHTENYMEPVAPSREEVIEEVIIPKTVNLKLSEERLGKVEETRVNGCHNGLTYAEVAKRGEKTFEIVTEPPKTKKRKKKGSTQVKIKKNRPNFFLESPPSPPPPPPPKPSPVSPKAKERGFIPKPGNIFTLLPKDDENVRMRTNEPKVIPHRTNIPKTNSPVRKPKEDTDAGGVNGSTTDNSGIAGAIAKLNLQPGGLQGTEPESASTAQEDYVRRQNWEMGTMDYMGRDSFDNIWSKICETLDGKVSTDLGSGGESTSNVQSEKAVGVVPEEPKEISKVEQPPDKTTAEDKKPAEGMPESVEGTITEGSDLSSKALQAFEAYGKLFVSGPVAIKSEVPPDVAESQEPKMEKIEAPLIEGGRKKSIETDDEGKKKKGVLSKILQLVGVEPSETPKSVFYDTEEKDKSEEKGKSVFYDVEQAKDQTNLCPDPEDKTKMQTPGPVPLQIAPGTKIVPPTPPPVSQTGEILAKDGKLLAAEEGVIPTPPITDRNVLDKVCDKEKLKTELDNIIETAVECVEEQMKEIQQVDKSGFLPKASEALEAFGKLFVSGPVTIKSEVQEDPKESTGKPQENVSNMPTQALLTKPQEKEPEASSAKMEPKELQDVLAKSLEKASGIPTTPGSTTPGMVLDKTNFQKPPETKPEGEASRVLQKLPEAKPEDKPAEPQKPAKVKSEEKAPAQKPAEPQKPKEAKPEEKASAQKPTEVKPEEKPAELQKPAEVKPEGKPAEPQKPKEAKPEEKAPAQKPTEVKPEEKPAEPQKPAEVKPEEKPAESQKPAEVKPEEKPAESQKPAEVKPEEKPAESQKPKEAKPKEKVPAQKPTEVKPEGKPSEPQKPAEVKTEGKPSEHQKPAEVKTEGKPSESQKPAEVKSEEKASTEKPAEIKPEEKPAESQKPKEAKPEEKASTEKPAEVKSEGKPSEPQKPAEIKPEEKPAEPQKHAEVKTEEKASTEKPAEVKSEGKPSEPQKPAEIKPEEKPAESQKPKEAKPEEKASTEKPAEVKTEGKPSEPQKPAEIKPEEKPAESQKPKEAKSEEKVPSQKPAEVKSEEKVPSQKPAEIKPEEKPSEPQKPAEVKSEEKVPSQKPAEVKPEGKPAEPQKPKEAKPEEKAPAQKPTEVKPEEKPAEPQKPAEVKSEEKVPSQKPAEVKSEEKAPAQKPAEVKPEGKPAEPQKPAEVKSEEKAPVQKPAEVKPEGKPAEPQKPKEAKPEEKVSEVKHEEKVPEAQKPTEVKSEEIPAKAKPEEKPAEVKLEEKAVERKPEEKVLVGTEALMKTGETASGVSSKPKRKAPEVPSKPAETPSEVISKSTVATSEGSPKLPEEVPPKPVETVPDVSAKTEGKVPDAPVKLSEDVQKPGDVPQSKEKISEVPVPEVTQKTSEVPTELASSKPESEIPSNLPETTSQVSATIPETPLGDPLKPIKDILVEVKEKAGGLISKVAEALPEIPLKIAEKAKEQIDSAQPTSIISKESQALEELGKVFVSGPVVLKSIIPDTPSEPVKESEGPRPQTSEQPSGPGESSAKVFVSGPVTIKSEGSQQAEPDAVHRVFQTRPEDEPIYCNIDEVEEIKVTSEEDRKKDKPQSSKLAEQILKAIPPEERKPFTEAASALSTDVSQFLASIEPQNVNILLDRPMTDEMVTEGGEASDPIPPVPPRRKSKGRDAPLPPPKKKGKNGKP